MVFVYLFPTSTNELMKVGQNQMTYQTNICEQQLSKQNDCQYLIESHLLVVMFWGRID